MISNSSYQSPNSDTHFIFCGLPSWGFLTRVQNDEIIFIFHFGISIILTEIYVKKFKFIECFESKGTERHRLEIIA